MDKLTKLENFKLRFYQIRFPDCLQAGVSGFFSLYLSFLSRDVSRKLFFMTRRMEERTGVVMDIRLPPFMSR